MTVKWTEAEDADMRALYPTTKNSDLAEIITQRHGNKRSESAIQNRGQVLGLVKAEGYKKPHPRFFWNDERRDWFVSFVPGHEESEISAEHERLFGTPLSEGQIGWGKKSFDVKSGTHGGRFEKGHEPQNKGKTWDEQGISVETQAKMREMCFKKGEVRDRSDGWIKPIGYERVRKDGYVEVKVRDSIEAGVQPKEPGKFNCNYKMKHHIVWEEAHGEPVPPSTMIVFANHDKRDFSLENLVAVPRRLWAVIARNDMAYFDAASLEACMKLAELKATISTVEHAPRACKVCGCEFEPRFKHQRTCDACLGREEKGNDQC